MTRVSTFGSYNSALLDLMASQRRLNDANEKVSTERAATDLGGFGRGAEALTAMKSTHARITGFKDTGETVAARLETQALAFDRVIDGAQSARQAIADALAAGRLDGLMAELQNQFQSVQDGLNTKHQGQFLFAGGRVDNAPLNQMTLEEMAAQPSVAGLFKNDQLKQSSRIDEGSWIQSGFLASEMGTELYTIFRDIQQFHEATALEGSPSPAMQQFLTDQMGRLDQARESITGMAANNGAMQNRVDSVIEAQEKQLLSLEQLTKGKTHVDPLKAVTELQLAQMAIQASAQVVSQLRDVSLLNYLR